MPQDAPLDIPFPTPINVHARTAVAPHVSALVSEGFLTSAENTARYRSWRLTELAARFYPDAALEDLVLGARGQAFFFFFDDLFDSHLGEDPAAAYQVCRRMAALARHTPGCAPAEPAFPLARMWLDLWEGLREGMSVHWQERAARHWERYFLSYVTEAADRATAVVLDLDAYLRLRRRSIGTDGVLDTAERCGRFEAPPEVHESTWIRELRGLTAEVVTLTNDVHSLEKDLANGEANNAVLILQRFHRCTEREAIAQIRTAIGDRTRAFERLASQAGRIGDALRLAPAQRDATLRFLDANRSCMRGNYDWSRHTPRYSPVGVRHVEDAPRIEDAVSRITR